MESFFELAVADAKEKHAAMPALVDVHAGFIRDSFTGTQAEVLEMLTKAAGDTKAGSGNPFMKDLMMKVSTQLTDDIDCLSSLGRWIALSVPMVETGGQWGADVQSHVLGIITKANDKLKANLETLPNYYKDRGEALKKIVPSVSRKTSASTSKSNTVGGKEDESGEKTATSESSSTESAESDALPDEIDFVAQIDLKWFNKLKQMSVDMMDTLAVVCDTCTKNMDKLDGPGTGGGGGIPMY